MKKKTNLLFDEYDTIESNNKNFIILNTKKYIKLKKLVKEFFDIEERDPIEINELINRIELLESIISVKMVKKHINMGD